MPDASYEEGLEDLTSSRIYHKKVCRNRAIGATICIIIILALLIAVETHHASNNLCTLIDTDKKYEWIDGIFEGVVGTSAVDSKDLVCKCENIKMRGSSKGILGKKGYPFMLDNTDNPDKTIKCSG